MVGNGLYGVDVGGRGYVSEVVLDRGGSHGYASAGVEGMVLTTMVTGGGLKVGFGVDVDGGGGARAVDVV